MSQSESIPILGIHINHELILSQFLESCLSHKFNQFKSLRYYFNDVLIQVRAIESDAQKGQQNLAKAQKRSIKLSESQKRSTKSTVD